MYFGIVKNNVDPEKLGRVKVSVFGCHDKIDSEKLGWSQVMMPGDTPAISGQGHSINLAQEELWEEGDALPDGVTIGDVKVVGSLVCGIFLDSFQQEFMVMGSLPTKTDAAFDNNDRVRSINPHVDDPKGEYEPDSTFAPVYPYNNVYETGSGHAKEYDDTPGYERIMERHKSGTQYEIQSDGTKIERVVRDNYQLVVGHDTLEVYGNVRIIVSGQADIAVANDVNVAVGGDLTAEVTGDISLVGVDANGNSQLGFYMENGNDNIKLMTVNNIVTMDNTNKKITLDTDNVEITGNLKVIGTTTTNEDLILDTHQHAGDGGDNSGPNTGGPANP